MTPVDAHTQACSVIASAVVALGNAAWVLEEEEQPAAARLIRSACRMLTGHELAPGSPADLQDLRHRLDAAAEALRAKDPWLSHALTNARYWIAARD